MPEQPQDKRISWCLRGLTIALLLVFLILWVPEYLVPDEISDATTKAKLVVANRDTLFKGFQAVAGLAFIFTAVFTWRNLNLTEDKNVTERFSKAIEMLADDKLEIRLGGIYLLERITKDSEKDYPVIIEVLTAFIRRQAARLNSGSEYIKAEQELTRAELLPPHQDVQSALTVVERINKERRKKQLDVQELNLCGANLNCADLVDADLIAAKLRGVDLIYAFLREARLNHADLFGADLSEADLREAKLINTKLHGAVLSYADLRRAKLNWTEMDEDTMLCEAKLEYADLSRAKLCKVKLISTNLSHADLSHADFTGADLLGARFDRALLLATDLRETEDLSIEQLTGEHQPYICGAALPLSITDVTGDISNRNCDELPQVLADRYGFSHKKALRTVKKAKNKQWD